MRVSLNGSGHQSSKLTMVVRPHPPAPISNERKDNMDILSELMNKILKVNLSEARIKVLDIVDMGLAYAKENIKALWWYNILDNRFEYSETAATHQDPKVFKGPFAGPKGWVRGRVFLCKEKCYVLVYMEDWLDHAVTNKSITDLYSHIQGKSKHTISDVVDEEGRTLTKNEKNSD